MPSDHTSDRRNVEPAPNVENTIPVLAVSDLQASIGFYRDVLGFKHDWGTGIIASVSRDGHAIMLQVRTPANPGCVWIGGPLLVLLWDKLKTGDLATIVRRPTNERWALNMMIHDPDANVLWFGDDPLPDVPFGAEPADDQLPRR